MIGALAYCKVEVENQAKFEAMMRDFIRQIRHQEGCIYYDFGKVLGKETEYIIVQKWATYQDLEAHLESPDFTNKAMKLVVLSDDFLAMDIFQILC